MNAYYIHKSWWTDVSDCCELDKPLQNRAWLKIGYTLLSQGGDQCHTYPTNLFFVGKWICTIAQSVTVVYIQWQNSYHTVHYIMSMKLIVATQPQQKVVSWSYKEYSWVKNALKGLPQLTLHNNTWWAIGDSFPAWQLVHHSLPNYCLLLLFTSYRICHCHQSFTNSQTWFSYLTSHQTHPGTWCCKKACLKWITASHHNHEGYQKYVSNLISNMKWWSNTLEIWPDSFEIHLTTGLQCDPRSMALHMHIQSNWRSQYRNLSRLNFKIYKPQHRLGKNEKTNLQERSLQWLYQLMNLPGKSIYQWYNFLSSQPESFSKITRTEQYLKCCTKPLCL